MTDLLSRTPGPWRVSEPTGSYILSESKTIAAMVGDASAADARLIAAAPTLLKACLDALLVEQHFGNERSELANRLRFAIFEAQGNLIV
jgi:hypothetical protein